MAPFFCRLVVYFCLVFSIVVFFTLMVTRLIVTSYAFLFFAKYKNCVNELSETIMGIHVCLLCIDQSIEFGQEIQVLSEVTWNWIYWEKKGDKYCFLLMILINFFSKSESQYCCVYLSWEYAWLDKWIIFLFVLYWKISFTLSAKMLSIGGKWLSQKGLLKL